MAVSLHHRLPLDAHAEQSHSGATFIAGSRLLCLTILAIAGQRARSLAPVRIIGMADVWAGLQASRGGL